jgi:hypothetical protein
MPTIKLTDQVGLEVDAELNKDAALAKYLKDAAAFKFQKIDFASLQKIPLDQAPVKSVDTGIDFKQKVGLGVDNTELTIAAGVSGGLKLHTARDKQLFDPDVFGDQIPIHDGEIFLSAHLQAKLSAEFAGKAGELSFGFTPSAQVVLSSYRLFQQPSGGAFPNGLDAIKETLGAFVIPGDLQDLERMDKGSVATVEGSGSLKLSASMDLLTVVNPLAVVELPGVPDPFGTLKVASAGAIKVGATFEISGAYQLRVQKVGTSTVRLGYYKRKGTEFTVKASASVGLSASISKFDVLEQLLKAISADPKADADELKKAALTDAQIEAIKKTVEAGISRKLEVAAIFELGAASTSEAAFLYEIDLSKLTDVSRSALHKALDGDLSGVSDSNLPPGITIVRSIFTETKKSTHTLKINLLGIFNFISVSKLILQGTVMFDRETGELVITDKATASRIAASTLNFAADGEKLRKVLAESVLLSVAYRCSKLVALQPQLKIAHSYIELHTKTDQNVMRNNLDVFQALALMTQKEKDQVLSSAHSFGRSVLNAETSYDDELATGLFLRNGEARKMDEYETVGRRALALLVQAGESDEFRRLPALDDSLWKEMRKVAQPGFAFVDKLKSLSADKLGAIRSDYTVIVWWAESMSEMAKQLAAIREFIKQHAQSFDPENNSFKQLRKKLAATLKDVASKTKSEFGDPWGLVAMDQMSGQKAEVKVVLSSSAVMLRGERKSQ